MTESKAIKIIKEKACDSRCIPPLCNDGCMYENTKCAFSMAIQALEKQIAKKPIFDHNLSDTLSKFHCECGNAIKVSHDVGIMDNNNAPNYCSKCGCRLDWGG